jgi:Uma2 family endonuclease
LLENFTVTPMVASLASLEITWEPLPDDFKLPDDPVDNINQPLLAAALTDSLAVAGKLSDNTLTPTNYGICATLNRQFVAKAPDWAFVPHLKVPKSQVERSYTPKLHGDIPTIVMEFISATDGDEYSTKPTYPPGKWFFYEQILKVPTYVIFNPNNGSLEVYRLNRTGRYRLLSPQPNGYWIEEMHLFLGVWEGPRETRHGYWLRWWDESGNLLLWAAELAERERLAKQVAQEQLAEERQRTQAAEQLAQAERQRAERLAERLRAAGLDVDE